MAQETDGWRLRVKVPDADAVIEIVARTPGAFPKGRRGPGRLLPRWSSPPDGPKTPRIGSPPVGPTKVDPGSGRRVGADRFQLVVHSEFDFDRLRLVGGPISLGGLEVTDEAPTVRYTVEAEVKLGEITIDPTAFIEQARTIEHNYEYRFGSEGLSDLGIDIK